MYSGPSLLEYLDNMQTLNRKINSPLMIPIIEKYKVIDVHVKCIDFCTLRQYTALKAECVAEAPQRTAGRC